MMTSCCKPCTAATTAAFVPEVAVEPAGTASCAATQSIDCKYASVDCMASSTEAFEASICDATDTLAL